MSATALVTGGSSGIGLEFAKLLAAKGFVPVLVSNRPDELESAAALIRSEFGIEAPTLCIDLAEKGAGEKLLSCCDEKGISPEIVVCNAGMFFMEYLSPENLPKARTMMALHMDCTTDICVLFGARMKERGSGRIIIMSSMTARIPAPGIAIYSASKAYLKSFGQSLSYELRPFGVYVTTVRPSAIDTGLYPLGDGLRRFLKGIGVIRSPRYLALRALRASERGRRSIAPGFTNILVPLLVSMLPSRLIDQLGKKWIMK